MIRAIVYDFDGVIADSVNIKTEAFVELYREYGSNITDLVKKYHLKHGGVSRFEKFKYWHKQYLNKDISQEELTELTNKFSSIVREKVIAAAFIPGAYDYIKEKKNNYLQFICTGTPTVEINYILKEKNLNHFFDDVFGSPENKTVILSKIKNEYKLRSDELIYFGDASTDLDAARAHGIKFIGINAVDIDTVSMKFENFKEIYKLSLDNLVNQ